MNEYVREYAKVERRARRRGSFLLIYAPWLLVAAVGAIFGRVWTQTRAVELVEEVATLRAQERELQTTNDELGRSLVELTTRERVSRAARESLQMVYPREDQVVFLQVEAPPEPQERTQPRRLAPAPTGLAAFVRERVRGLVNRDAYALGAM